MSHLHERAEKTCLNCGAHLTGRYCHDCGQENLEPKESFTHLLAHFVEDVTHFDGKFFTSIKYLFTKPGFLTDEYIKGRRASYLNPIRMYLFISALFFLIYMSFFVGHDNTTKEKSHRTPEAKQALHDVRQKLDSLDDEHAIVKTTTDGNKKVYDLGTGDKITVDTTVEGANSWTLPLREYDSLQNVLPPNKKDGFFASLL